MLTGRAANRFRDLLFIPGSEKLWLNRMRGCVTALLYHRVAEPGEERFLDAGGPPIPPAQLERELRLLKRWGARFLTFRDLRDGVFPQDDEVGIVITFDDGMRENYTIALDIVESVGGRAVLFQISSIVEGARLLWEHELYWHLSHDPGTRALAASVRRLQSAPHIHGRALVEWLRESTPPETIEAVLDGARSPEGEGEQCVVATRIYPTASQLAGAVERGHEIGSHGQRHYKRSNISAELFELECSASRQSLEALSRSAVESFSWPFSSVAPGDGSIVLRHYRQAMIVAPGGDAWRIRRTTDRSSIPRFTWRGPFSNALRERRWLLEGTA